MQAAQDRKKSYADRKRKPMEFEVRDRVMLKVSPWKGVVRFECYADEPLVMPLEGIHVDDKLQFVEEPVEIMEREIKRLKRSRIPLVKVRWNSRRGPEFTWEREDSFKQKYPQLFTNRTSSSTTSQEFRIFKYFMEQMLLAKKDEARVWYRIFKKRIKKKQNRQNRAREWKVRERSKSKKCLSKMGQPIPHLMGRNYPAFYHDDDEDDDEEYTIAITPVLPTVEPDNSLSMGDEHLSTIPEKEESSVEDLVPIPIPNDDFASSVDVPLLQKDIDYVDAITPDSESSS
ncbi:hypothetical protein Tco_0317108 [Tanacetum coccineum]